jgi:hypothetical protein
VTDDRAHRIEGARAVAGDAPFVIGTSHGQLVWADGADAEPHALWSIGDAHVEGLRAVPLAEGRGWAITFRHGSTIAVGAIDRSRHATGDLFDVPGQQASGVPAITTSGDDVVVAWARGADAPTSMELGWLTWHPGEPPALPTSWHAPSGGLGGSALAPSLASLGGGALLVVWAEGPIQTHELRAQVVDAKGAPRGAAVNVSDAGINVLGPAQAALTEDGRGVVSFYASGDTGFDLVATFISCRPGGDDPREAGR